MVSPNAEDERHMRAALAEAGRGAGKTSPNPAVGAVITKGRRIIGRGFHRAAGMPHAEIEAIRSLKSPSDARGATLYVTLEPCSTSGRTPPCTRAIIDHGFARVVYGATDPNPSHCGRACSILEKAGISVTEGILSEACADMNRAWNHWIMRGTPYVIAKCGMSLDGRISSHPESRWITSAASRADAMEIRRTVDAILIGGGTLRTDNPQLTVRPLETLRPHPWRVIVSQGGNLPANSRVFCDAQRDRTLVFEGQPLSVVLRALGKMEVTSVLIEGGGRLLGEAFDDHLVNEVAIYLAPQMLGGPVSAVGGRGIAKHALACTLSDVRYQRIGDDVRMSGRVD